MRNKKSNKRESFEEAKVSAKNANILLKVSEFESIDQATEALIAMKSAYDELSEENINDILNLVGNNFSISTSGLASALQDSASALKTANNDMFESVALITAGNQITQDPDQVGKGIRTIALRLTGKMITPERIVIYGYLKILVSSYIG